MTVMSVVIVTGLSGGGKASILRALEDIGYEAVDNPPVTVLEEVIADGDKPKGDTPDGDKAAGGRKLAVGIDARTRGFDAGDLLDAVARLRADSDLSLQLVYAWADESTLLRRYTETRRRHPLAPQGVVADGIAAETALTEPLREAADLVVDTSGLPISNLRRMIERHFGADAGQAPRGLAGILRLSQGTAARSRSGIRCTLPQEPSLRSHITAENRVGPGSRGLHRG